MPPEIDSPQTTAEVGDSSVAIAAPAEGAPATTLEGQIAALQSGTTDTTPDETPTGGPDPDAPPEGTNEKQLSRWGELRKSRDEWKTQAEAAAASLEATRRFEPFKDELSSFMDLAESAEADPDREGRELERVIYELNPALWEAMVRRAGTVYAEELGLTPQAGGAPAPQVPPAPVALPPPPTAYQPPTAAGPYQFTDAELDDLAVYGQAYVDKAKALMAAAQSAGEAQRIATEVKAQLDAFQQQQDAAATQAANDKHDAQFSEEISNQLVALGVPRFIERDGKQDWNPEFVALWKYFDKAFDADKDAYDAREASRRAYRDQQRAAQPRLSAAVRSRIGTVIARDVAPLLGPRQAQQLAQTEAAKRAAAAPAVPEPGGTSPPATGQVGKLSLIEQIARVKAGQPPG